METLILLFVFTGLLHLTMEIAGSRKGLFNGRRIREGLKSLFRTMRNDPMDILRVSVEEAELEYIQNPTPENKERKITSMALLIKAEEQTEKLQEMEDRQTPTSLSARDRAIARLRVQGVISDEDVDIYTKHRREHANV